ASRASRTAAKAYPNRPRWSKASSISSDVRNRASTMSGLRSGARRATRSSMPGAIMVPRARSRFTGSTTPCRSRSRMRGRCRRSKGCVYIELTTSGKAWGRGPVPSDIHGSNKRAVDSPAWRHIRMLGSLVSPDGNTPLIKGFTDGLEPLSPEETAALKKAAEKTDMKVAAENIGVARFIADEPFTMLKMARYGISFNLDGIWGGNMYAGGAGAILPNKITSKHNTRYVPNM